MNQTLRYVWGEYRAWAMTSRELKARVQRVSLVVLGLMIGGTALGTLSPLLGGAGALASASDASFIGRLPPPWREVAHLLVSAVPWLAAVALGIATYLTNQLLSESERQGWTKARALAEGLKSEAHKYIMGAPPYDVPNAAQLLGQKASDLQRVVAGVLPVLISPEERARNLPAASWTIADYTEKRVNEQIERYYEPAIGRHRAAVGRARNVALGAGVLVVFLSAVTTGTTAAGALAGACLGIVTTTAAIIAAWFQSGRHQQLALNYQDAVTKLRRLTATADVTGTQLVVDAEAVFQAEHAAWLAEWQTPSAEARASGTGTGPESRAPAPQLAVAGTRGEAAVTPGS